MGRISDEEFWEALRTLKSRQVPFEEYLRDSGINEFRPNDPSLLVPRLGGWTESDDEMFRRACRGERI